MTRPLHPAIALYRAERERRGPPPSAVTPAMIAEFRASEVALRPFTVASTKPQPLTFREGLALQQSRRAPRLCVRCKAAPRASRHSTARYCEDCKPIVAVEQRRREDQRKYKARKARVIGPRVEQRRAP